MAPASGRILAEDGSTVNIVDLLGAAAPVSDTVHDIEAYSPRSGRVIGEDGKLYNIVDLLAGVGGNGGGGTPGRVIRESVDIKATAETVLTISKGSTIALENGNIYTFDTDAQIGAGNLDTIGYFIAGNDYRIFISDTSEVIISLERSLPACRNIGGFHFGGNRRSNAALQPINPQGVARGEGWEANVYIGIVPRSVWTFLHRPGCNPEGMVYLGNGVWVDIYQASDDGAGGFISKYNVLPTTGAALNWYTFVERLLVSGKRLLSYQEFIGAALGSPTGTSSGNLNAWSQAAERQVTGFVDRAVSSIGCRDCVGNIWEWLSDLIASGSGTEQWQDAMPAQGLGQMWLFEINNFRALLAGGSHFNGALAGSRSACLIYAPWANHGSFGARGACNSL